MATPMRLPPLPTIREIIRLYNLRAKKQLSQNFLMDLNLCRKIVRKAGNLKDGWVCEVGPGPGGITRCILEKEPREVALIEKDKRFFPGLELVKEAYGGQVNIYHGDVLKFDMENLIPKNLAVPWTDPTPNIHIIGNLPFSVSTPLIIQWLHAMSERRGAWSHGRACLTLTFQREVAERMTAPLGDRQRCRLSIMCQYLCKVQNLFTIPGKAFVPAPDVDVAVVRFKPLVKPLIDVPFKMVEKVVRHTFHYRQKMCKRGIISLFPTCLAEEFAEEMISAANIEATQRCFTLTVGEVGKLCEAYAEICSREKGIFEYDYRNPESVAAWQEKNTNLRKIHKGG